MAISYGSKGAAVVALQNQLTKAGFPPRSGVDGVYGNDTETAIQSASAALNVPGQSGIASDELLGALNAAVGPGNTVIGSTPPGGLSSTNITSTWGLDLSKVATPNAAVKIGLGVLGLAIVAAALTSKKK